MVIEVLRGDYTVLHSSTCYPGAWGTQGFNTFAFQYQGDGSGPVLVRVGPLAPSGHFGGSIDNLRVATDYVPSNPPEVTQDPTGGTVDEGDDFTFSVLATGLPTYQWTKDGQPIPGATSATYVIVDVRTDDAGTYAVVLTNPDGTVTSAPAVLGCALRSGLAIVRRTRDKFGGQEIGHLHRPQITPETATARR